MANDFIGNPIVLDTFTGAIDVGDSVFGNSNAMMKIIHIEWQTPENTSHTALITDADSNIVFSERCTTQYQSILKDFYSWIRGLKIGVSGVGSGKISILLG